MPSLGIIVPPVKLFPNAKTIVFFGSSTQAGLGSSTYGADPSAATGWASPTTSFAGRISASLAGAGFVTFNRSKSGTSSADSVARFFTDVAPHRPSHVVLGTSIHNEPNIGTDPQAAVKTYIANMRVQINYCQIIGAKPILISALPNAQNTTPTNRYAALLDLNAQLEQFGCPVIDVLTTLDNGSGGFYGGSSYSVDGTHVNDAGHAAYFDAFDLSYFTAPAVLGGLPDLGAGSWKAANNSAGGVTVKLSSGAKSFAMRAKVKGDASAGSLATIFAAYCYAAGAAPLRVRFNSVYQFVDSTGAALVAATINPSTDTAVHDMAINYNAVQGVGALIIDGVSVGTLNPAGTTPTIAADTFNFAARSDNTAPAVNFSFSDLCVWRSPLSVAALANIAFTGRVPTSSLVFRGRLNQPPRQLLTNTAQTDVLPTNSGTWTQIASF